MGLVVERVIVENGLLTEEDQQLENTALKSTFRLIVDEIGMVSAHLLAQMDQRIRSAKPAADEWNRPRPFGGVNVLFTGDFAQLPPPEGGGIAEIPASLKPRGDHAPGRSRASPSWRSASAARTSGGTRRARKRPVQ